MKDIKHKTGWKAFKDSGNLLVLLGFICQGFAWDNYFMAIVFTGIWSLCLAFSRKKQFIPREVEFFIFFASVVLAFMLAGNDAHNRYLSSVYQNSCTG